ncbi:MAG: hypothetical protein LH624_20465, partial [Cryobacterium sp.]|nr:hypothetical protein [Cryobacterium sp.]
MKSLKNSAFSKPAKPGIDGPIDDTILKLGRFLRRGQASPDQREVFLGRGREAHTVNTHSCNPTQFINQISEPTT